MMPPPAGSWGMPPEILQTLPGYGSDVANNRAEARETMKKLGYGSDKRLAVTVTTRDAAAYRDPAVLLIDQFAAGLCPDTRQPGYGRNPTASAEALHLIAEGRRA